MTPRSDGRPRKRVKITKSADIPINPIPHPFIIKEMRVLGADGRVIKEIAHLDWARYGWEVKP